MVCTTHNPYIEGRREWSDRYSDLARGKRNWQITTAACLAVIAAQSGMIIWQAGQSAVAPYIVQVDDLRRIVQVVPAEQTAVRDPRIIRPLLGDFIVNARTITADRIAMKRMLERAYAYAGASAREVLDGYYRGHDPFARATTETVTVEVSSVLPLSDQTYQVQWKETTRALDGRLSGETRWQAALTWTMDARQAADTASLATNPLGLYVTGLAWTEIH